MGFWDSLGEGLKKASDKANNHNQEVSRYMDYYSGYSTSDLKKEGKRGGSLAKKSAILKLLRERGEIN